MTEVKKKKKDSVLYSVFCDKLISFGIWDIKTNCAIIAVNVLFKRKITQVD